MGGGLELRNRRLKGEEVGCRLELKAGKWAIPRQGRADLHL